MWHDTFWTIGGPENIAKEYIVGACSYHEGRYIEWDEIVSLYDREAAARMDAEYDAFARAHGYTGE